MLLTPLAGRTGEVQSCDPSLALPHEAETTRALHREREAFPDAQARVAALVHARDQGTTAQDAAAAGP